MPPAGFEPAIPASVRSQTYALYRAVIGTGLLGVVDQVKKKEDLVRMPTTSVRPSVCDLLSVIQPFF
jgi:hypothetical protein